MRRHVVAAFIVVTALAAVLAPAAPASAAPPPNDDFADASTIAGAQGRVPVSLEEATLEAGEPRYRTSRSYPAPHRSVWFRWTAPADGWYQFELENAGADDCIGTSPVFRGDTLDSLTKRSHHSATDLWESTDVSFVRVLEGQTFSIAAASNCYAFGYDLALVWEQRGPLIVTALRPDGSGEPGVDVEECMPGSPPDVCWDGDYFGTTDAAGRVYFRIHRYDALWRLELRPRSLNLASRVVQVSVPPSTANAVTAKRSLRAQPSVDLDRDGRGDVVSGVPLADRGRVNAGAVVVQFGNGRRRVIDEASAGVPTGGARGEQFGAAVATADVDRDGWTDLTIGAPGEMIRAVRAGAVFVVFGSAQGLGNGRPSVRYHQDLPSVAGDAREGDRFGAAVAPGLHHSFTHFMVGIPGKNSGGKSNAGAVVRFTTFVRSGFRQPPSRMWHQGTPGVGGSNRAGDRFGSALAHGGFSRRPPGEARVPYLSLAIGVPGKDVAGAANAGAIVVLRGVDFTPDYADSGNPLITQNSAAVVPANGARAGNAFGSALVAFREQVPLETEARDRLVVGAPGEGGGTVTVLSSGVEQELVFASAEDNTRLVQGRGRVPGADEEGDRFGAALAVGDVNDDREPDLVVGAPREEAADRAAAGGATLLYGRRSPARPSRWVVAGGATVRPGRSGVPGRPTRGARFGASVAALDVNGNGYPDVVAGAPGSDGTAVNGGAVYVAYRAAGGLRGGRVVLWQGARRNDGFGAQLAAPQLVFSQF